MTAGFFSQTCVIHLFAADCLEDMRQSAIIHDGIFDFVDERQNIPVEKEFGDAAGAKGFRPCTPASHDPFSHSPPRIPSRS
jgi:hypothetical protein